VIDDLTVVKLVLYGLDPIISTRQLLDDGRVVPRLVLLALRREAQGREVDHAQVSAVRGDAGTHDFQIPASTARASGSTHQLKLRSKEKSIMGKYIRLVRAQHQQLNSRLRGMQAQCDARVAARSAASGRQGRLEALLDKVSRSPIVRPEQALHARRVRDHLPKPSSASFHCELSGRARVTKSLDSMKGIIDREKGARIEPFWALDVDYSCSPPRLREVKVVGVQQMSFRSMDKSPRWVVQLPKKKKGEGTIRIFRKHLWPNTAKARAAVATLMRIEDERVRILDNMAAEETRAKQSGGLMTASFDHPMVKPKKVEIKPVVMKFLRKSK
jgi:hypothetical protein